MYAICNATPSASTTSATGTVVVVVVVVLVAAVAVSAFAVDATFDYVVAVPLVSMKVVEPALLPHP